MIFHFSSTRQLRAGICCHPAEAPASTYCVVRELKNKTSELLRQPRAKTSSRRGVACLIGIRPEDVSIYRNKTLRILVCGGLDE